MSNFKDKAQPKRSPLVQLHNTVPSQQEKHNNVENLFKAPTTSNISKKLNEASGIKAKIASVSQENPEETDEYIKTLKGTLKEAVEENDKLRTRVSELESLLSAAEDEIEQRDKAILELANLLEAQKAAQRERDISPVCQRKSNKKKLRRNSKSTE